MSEFAAGVVSVVLMLAALVGVVVLVINSRPDCASGTIPMFTQYNGWLCVAGSRQ